MNKLRAYFRVICAPIRSWSDISAQHFPSLPPGGPKFCTSSLICTSSKFCLVRDVRDDRGDHNTRRPKLASGKNHVWGDDRSSRKWLMTSSRSITPQNNRHLNQGVLHLCFKFGDSTLNGWWVIVRTSKWLIHTQTHTHTDRYTDRGDENTRRPKLASGKNHVRGMIDDHGNGSFAPLNSATACIINLGDEMPRLYCSLCPPIYGVH